MNYFHVNVGDPFHFESHGFSIMHLEKNVILYFAELVNLNKDEAWGYIASSSTEAIL